MPEAIYLASTAMSGASSPVPGGDRPIAIVEDDAGVLESLGFMLQAAGYEVATYNGAAAFLRDDQGEALGLIVDQHMPEMTGLELAQELRTRGDVRRVLLITAAPTPSIHARAKELGIERVLEKPLSDDDLFEFIENLRESD
jgi:two-component system, LuxR family, response regulator FixJ